MTLEKFQEHAALIMANPNLSDKQQEKKIIQLADITRFVEKYNPDLHIVDYTTPVNVVEREGNRYGILFCDSNILFESQNNDVYLTNPYTLEISKRALVIQELWLVFVEDQCHLSLKPFLTFLEKNTLNTLYNKIFFLNYFQSVIHELK
mgnify:CR=1 FL=1